MDYYKINNINEIHISDKTPSLEFVFFKEYIKRRVFKPNIVLNNVYENYGWGDLKLLTENEVLNIKRSDGQQKYLVINNVVYNRCQLVVKFNHRDSKDFNKLFDTKDSANKWVQTILKKYNLSEEIIKLY